MEETYKTDPLLLTILRGDANEEEIQSFSEWIQNEENATYFNTVKQAWMIAESLSSTTPVNQTGREQYLNRIRSDKKRARSRYLILTSASVAAALMITYFYFGNTSNVDQLPKHSKIIAKVEAPSKIKNEEVTITSSTTDGNILKVTKISNNIIQNSHFLEIGEPSDSVIEMNTLSVPKGRRILVLLSDGTKMWVNSDSKVIYPAIFAKDKRTLEVIGNVYFDVAKDPSRPFEVMANGIKTTALGTQFEVNNYGKQQCLISLLEGVISVENSDKKLIVEPNNQVIAQAGSDNLVKSPFDPQNYGLWRTNVLVIDNEPISSIIEKLNRWHNVKIINKTKDIDKIRFTGKLSDNTLEEHLKIIVENIKIKFTKEGDTIILKN